MRKFNMVKSAFTVLEEAQQVAEQHNVSFSVSHANISELQSTFTVTIDTKEVKFTLDKVASANAVTVATDLTAIGVPLSTVATITEYTKQLIESVIE